MYHWSFYFRIDDRMLSIHIARGTACLIRNSLWVTHISIQFCYMHIICAPKKKKNVEYGGKGPFRARVACQSTE